MYKTITPSKTQKKEHSFYHQYQSQKESSSRLAKLPSKEENSRISSIKKFKLPLNQREILCPSKSKYFFSISDCWYIKKKLNEYFDIRKVDISTLLKNKIMQDVADKKYVENIDFSKFDRKQELKYTLNENLMNNPEISERVKMYLKKRKFEKSMQKELLVSMLLHKVGGRKKRKTKTKNKTKNKTKTKTKTKK